MATAPRILFAATVLCAALQSASPALAGCPPQPWPQDTCGSFATTSLVMDAYGHVDWRGSDGTSSDASEFSDPAATYKLCIWDESRVIVAADINADAECPGGSCWSDHKKTVRRYRDEAGANGDVRLLDFTASDDSTTEVRAEILVIGGLNLPVHGGVIAQMVSTTTGACLESFVPSDAFKIDDKGGFAAKFSLDEAE